MPREGPEHETEVKGWQDQVCGCEVDETAAQFKSEFEGRTYYFCTAGCKAKFDSDPRGGPGAGDKIGVSG